MIFALLGHLWLTYIPNETGIIRATSEIPVKKKREEKLSPGIMQKFTTGGQTPCRAARGAEQAFRGCFWCASPRAHMHALPTPAHLLFYRVCYLRQPVEVIAILLSYMLIHLHQKGRQKFECANHHYPVM